MFMDVKRSQHLRQRTHDTLINTLYSNTFVMQPLLFALVPQNVRFIAVLKSKGFKPKHRNKRKIERLLF